MACDLHTHSAFSDGTYTPAQILEEAEALGLTAVALTDHNDIGGLPEFMAAAAGKKVTAVPGIEFSADYGKTELHIVALFVHEEDYPAVGKLMEQTMLRKEESNILLVERLGAAGYKLDYAELKASTIDGFVNRAVVGAALVQKGYVASVQEAFDKLLKPEHGFYEQPKREDVFDIIRFIRSIGAVSVLAHPFLNLSKEELDVFLKKAVDAGLDAMEVAYSTYDEETAALAKEMAEKYGLLFSGGSDFHGSTKPDIALGSGRGNLCIPDSWWKTFAILAEERAGGQSFSAAEKLAFYQRKWEQDHRMSLIAGILLLAAVFLAGVLWQGWLCALAVVMLPLFMALRNNKKMSYAEWKTYVEPRIKKE